MSKPDEARVADVGESALPASSGFTWDATQLVVQRPRLRKTDEDLLLSEILRPCK